MRWLSHRGGALDFRVVRGASGRTLPVSVALGADPATILGAVTPVPDTLSEYASQARCAAPRPKWLSAFPMTLKCRPARKLC